ncbi:bifunctional diaminohydroxyphosphoribosylaminopyrimidine deaminase/5-amino-6-(5-phosphoribosylamino)uracil reductase RibD [Winogradskyella sp. DF17]|uniref:Riboflavin biosynthesis protein RibD n=1 Tax=Winogradskyella pelagia TaxID=2819984 RepID=A0ABS3T3M5_9FLAO|nr:bifunctional diaminohydroxyphosphoribosylaminopyrimidine deaminase/5-amino-6-(5-phosphoribosylamino)uracil reductase RibD [Winogradskyella sp. DF17]MBO3117343.1 bifunctional diaminohydroxyphosphoribosylaminopyrimidine deaminase/5-amino-6-(5-phosphoribosylamino)uracil reductase RibD [Winogradskyella sp. DF17]
MTQDEKYIHRCLQIGTNGLGSTRPNPMVGSVIVLNNEIIGEGFTSPYGGPHAEVNAINSVKYKDALEKATLYVTLEPCSHFGKTPPCSDLILEKRIPRIVIGCMDDNPTVAGRGIEKLKSAGCDVMVGILNEECKKHHRRFFTFVNKKRPYIILKWAETSDGFIAPIEKKEQNPVWITNGYSRQLVHKWRAEEQAILVGTKTVMADNPSLTVRDWHGNNPTRYILGTSDINMTDFQIRNNEATTVLLNEDIIDFKQPVAAQVCNYLFNNDVNSIIIEGGTTTLQSFIDEGLWDEARVFKGTGEFKNGTKAPEFYGKLISSHNYLNDTLKIYEQN